MFEAQQAGFGVPGGGALAETKVVSLSAEHPVQGPSTELVELGIHQVGARVHHCDLRTERTEPAGSFQPEQAATDNRRTRFTPELFGERGQMRSQVIDVVDPSVDDHLVGAGDGRAGRFAAGRQHQVIPPVLGAVFGRQTMPGGVNGAHPLPGEEAHAGVFPGAAAQGQLVSGVGEAPGEGHTVVGDAGFLGEDGHLQ